MDNSLQVWIQKLLVTIGIAILLYGVYILRDLAFLLLISGFLTLIINPLVNKGERFHIPAWVTVIAVFIAIFLLGSIVIGTLLPIVVNYISEILGTVSLWANSTKEVFVSQ
jgi:predicted PurR-regulated permease PerM